MALKHGFRVLALGNICEEFMVNKN